MTTSLASELPAEPPDGWASSRAAVRESRAVIAHHSKSFALASRLLSPTVRDDAVVVYAWCRRADDAIDLTSPPEQPAALARLEAELDALYAGEATGDVVLAAFREVAQRRAIPRHYPRELLAGMRMDVVSARYETWDDLLLYCYRVAGVVGLMMAHVLGVSSDAALPSACHLGVAMQLTNIARDVAEDWDRGRLYLPQELLTAVTAAGSGEGQAEPGAVPLSEIDPAWRRRLAAATLVLLDHADAYYASGDAGLPALSARSAWSIRTARLVYSRIGTVVRRRGGDPLAGRAYVSLPWKLALVARALVGAATELPARALRHERPRTPERLLSFPDAVELAGDVDGRQHA